MEHLGTFFWSLKFKNIVTFKDSFLSQSDTLLVAQGFTLFYDIHSSKTFSLVAWLNSMRIQLLFAVEEIWILTKLDVNNDFFMGILQNKGLWRKF